MDKPGTKSRVIPINLVAAAAATETDELHRRLVRDGWLRQTTIGEPRLSALVKTYEKLGYEVRVEAYQDGGDHGGAGGCGTGECDTGADAGEVLAPYMGTAYIRKGLKGGGHG